MDFAIIHDTKTLKEYVAQQHAARKRVALVPTMGALHAGHMSLVETAKQHAEFVILYIFLNPKQFAPTEDLARYPKTWEADIARCKQAGVDVVYAPSAEDVYPRGFDTTVIVNGVSAPLEGAARPDFFGGVATVLTKMFLRVGADVAVFGEKDYQQLQVVKKLVRDLDIPTVIIGAPTVREADGLAMSSRNQYLSAEERAIAANLYGILNETAEVLRGNHSQTILENAGDALLNAGFSRVDYVALADAETLLPITTLDKPARLLAAAWLGNTRLIDNISVVP